MSLSNSDSNISKSSVIDYPKFSWFIIALGTLAGLGPFSIDMYLPAFSDIEQDLGINISHVQYSLVSFFAGIGLGQIFYGPISDRFGRKIPLQIGLIIYIISSIICALSKNIEMLIISRFFQAFGCSAPMVIIRAIVRDRFSGNSAARVFSMLILVMSVAPILAPIIGGYVTINFGWRWIFWFLAILCVMCFILTIKFPETNKLELRSVNITFKSVLANYIYIFKDRSFIGYALASGFAYADMFAYITGSPFIIINYYGISKEHFGWFFGANAFALILVSQLNNFLLLKYFYHKLLQFGLFIMLTSAFALFIAFSSHVSLWIIAPLFFINIGAMGFITPNAAAGALANHGLRAGSASALIGVIQFLFAALSSFSVGLFHNGTGIPTSGIMVLCMLLSFTSYFLIIKPYIKLTLKANEG